MQQDGEEREPGPAAPWLFPREYALGAAKWLQSAIHDLSRITHPILGSTGRMTVSDLPEPQNESSSDSDLASPLYRGIHLQHEWTTSVDEVLSFDVDSLLSNIGAAADEMGGQLVKAMVEHISAICESTGNTVAADGRDFYEVIIETTENMELAFDEDGNLAQQILVHPDMYEKLAQNPPTAEQEARIKAIIDRKRDEWNAARRRRELPEIPD